MTVVTQSSAHNVLSIIHLDNESENLLFDQSVL